MNKNVVVLSDKERDYMEERIYRRFQSRDLRDPSVLREGNMAKHLRRQNQKSFELSIRERYYLKEVMPLPNKRVPPNIIDSIKDRVSLFRRAKKRAA